MDTPSLMVWVDKKPHGKLSADYDREWRTFMANNPVDPNMSQADIDKIARKAFLQGKAMMNGTYKEMRIEPLHF